MSEAEGLGGGVSAPGTPGGSPRTRRAAVLLRLPLRIGPLRLSEAPGATRLRTGGPGGQLTQLWHLADEGAEAPQRDVTCSRRQSRDRSPGVRSLSPASSFHTTSQRCLRLLLRERGGCGTGHARWRGPALPPPQAQSS